MTDVLDALAELRGAIAWPQGGDLTAGVLDRLGPRRRASRRPWPVVAVAAVAAGAVAVPVAADLFSVRGVRIVGTGELPYGLTVAIDLGAPTDIRASAARPRELGPPVAAFAGEPIGGYTEVWHGPVVLTSFPGRLDRQLIEKRVFEGGDVERTTVDGVDAWWVGGRHAFLYLDAAGRPREETLRLSGSALLWTVGDTTYRLEGLDSLERAVEVARSMR